MTNQKLQVYDMVVDMDREVTVHGDTFRKPSRTRVSIAGVCEESVRRQAVELVNRKGFIAVRIEVTGTRPLCGGKSGADGVG